MAVTFSGAPVSAKSCPDGLIKVADIVEINLLLTCRDLSLLYGNGTGIVCLNPADPTAFPIAKIDGAWDSGTGRFGNADGTWSLRFGCSSQRLALELGTESFSSCHVPPPERIIALN